MSNLQSPIPNHLVFDRRRVRRQRERASADFSAHDFLLREMAERIADRLDDMKRTFPLALNLGAHNGLLAEYVQGKYGIETLVQTDLSARMLASAPGLRVVADEEAIPFADNSFDLVISAGSLHWVNDLPGTLVQIQRILKPDGLFLAILPGGQTLMELRDSFEKAETELRGGISPRVSPFIDIRDAGNLLQRARFALQVVDSEIITASYEHPLKLMKELRGMGEGNALIHAQKHFTSCELMMLAVDQYFRNHCDASGRVIASFELVTFTAWKPHASQQQPAQRGSGQINLRDVLDE